MRQVVYVSSATRILPRQAIVALLLQARRNNARTGITGALLYHSGNFMQALEGPVPAVASVLDRIRADRRHHSMITVLDEPCPRRDFEGLPMASGPDAARLGAHWLPGEAAPSGVALPRDSAVFGLLSTFMTRRTVD